MFWLSGHPAQLNKKDLLPPEMTRKFTGTFWPFTDDYFNPLNAVFSVQILSEQILNRRPVWYLRDGLIPLIWFFKTFSQPKNIKSTLIVPVKFAEIVPIAWRAQVKYYEIVQVEADVSAVETLYVVGLIGAPHLDLDLLKNRIHSAQKLLGARLNKIEKLFYVPARHGDVRDQIAQFEAYRELFEAFGFNGRAIDWHEATGSRLSQKSAVLSLVADAIINDDYATQVGASRGAIQTHLLKVKSLSDIQIPLSPYHGLNIFGSLTEAKSAGRAIQSRGQLMSVIGSKIYLGFEWPDYFKSWQ